ncbi:hypothetical protein, partial [Petrachloros mirabilis]
MADRTDAAFRNSFRIAILATCLPLSQTSFLHAAELFPFEPPSATQQRTVEKQSSTALSVEDRDRISKLANQAKQLSPSDQKQLKQSLRRSLDSAIQKGDLNQVQ